MALEEIFFQHCGVKGVPSASKSQLRYHAQGWSRRTEIGTTVSSTPQSFVLVCSGGLTSVELRTVCRWFWNGGHSSKEARGVGEVGCRVRVDVTLDQWWPRGEVYWGPGTENTQHWAKPYRCAVFLCVGELLDNVILPAMPSSLLSSCSRGCQTHLLKLGNHLVQCYNGQTEAVCLSIWWVAAGHVLACALTLLWIWFPAPIGTPFQDQLLSNRECGRIITDIYTSGFQ